MYLYLGFYVLDISYFVFFFFFFNDTATTEIYTLSLHDALPIDRAHGIGARHEIARVRGGARLAVRPRTGTARPGQWRGERRGLNVRHRNSPGLARWKRERPGGHEEPRVYRRLEQEAPPQLQLLALIGAGVVACRGARRPREIPVQLLAAARVDVAGAARARGVAGIRVQRQPELLAVVTLGGEQVLHAGEPDP